jgi:hypothetical protein
MARSGRVGLRRTRGDSEGQKALLFAGEASSAKSPGAQNARLAVTKRRSLGIARDPPPAGASRPD